MMSKLSFFLILISFFDFLSAKNDTTKIVFFLDSNIQQFKGPEWHRIAQKIPKGTYNKAILKIDLGCATYGCCAWDYTYRGFFSSKRNDTSFNDIEVARLITPYSSFMRRNKQGYDSTWSHPYTYDVTDYLPLLNSDSIFYSAHTGGWDDKGKFGFKHTVTLYLIKGNAISVSRVLPIYQNAYRYHDSTQFDSLMKSYKFILTENETKAKFRMIFTGHDQQGEFSPIPFYLRVNGKNIYSKRLWKTDCDKNAIQPQSGTWIFSRCNWCPGEKVNEIEVDLSTYITQGENEIKIALGKIETQDSQINANYLIEGDVILYQSLSDYDIELVSILAPSTDPNYKMYNPTCMGAKLLIKNVGSKAVDTIKIIGIDAQLIEYEFQKKVEIKPFESQIIEINGVELINGSSIGLKSNSKNKNKENDNLVVNGFHVSKFETNKLIFEITTTNDSSYNHLSLFDYENKKIFTEKYYNNDKTYRDTIDLKKGCYQLALTDYDKNYECGDGLSFWYSSRVGKKTSGIFKIYDAKSGKLLKVFNPDFGGKINYQFIIN